MPLLPESAVDAVKKVHERARAKGVHPTLIAFLDWWEENGEFDILVAPDGGVRTDPAVQLAAFNAGNSKARTLDQTPHGRAAALDLWPVGFQANRDWAGQKDQTMMDKFRTIGTAWKENFGGVWGGDWLANPGDAIGWDAAHCEIKGWAGTTAFIAALPYPPPNYGTV